MTFEEATKTVRQLGWSGVAVWQPNPYNWDGCLLAFDGGPTQTIDTYGPAALKFRQPTAIEALEAVVELAGKLHDEAVQRGG